MENQINLSYTQLRQVERGSKLHEFAIPTEHYCSLPMPTRRFDAAGIAMFACPAVRSPGQPLQVAAPDRWWVVDTVSARLLVYALQKSVPFAALEIAEPMTLLPSASSIAAIKSQINTIEVLMDALLPAFIAGGEADKATRKALSEALAQAIPDPLKPIYRALAPDFWAWLEG